MNRIIRIAALTALLTGIVAIAQTSTGLSASAGPVAINYHGTWSAASWSQQSYDVYDFGASKGTHVYADGIQLLAPTPAINFYMGGATVQPDFSALTSKTNLPKFTVAFSGGIGVAAPSVGMSSIAWHAGGRLTYQVNADLQWHTLEYHYVRDGAQGFDAISTELQFVFGPSAAKTALALKRAAAKK